MHLQSMLCILGELKSTPVLMAKKYTLVYRSKLLRFSACRVPKREILPVLPVKILKNSSHKL